MILLNVQILHGYYSPVFNLPAKGQKLWHLTFGIWHCHTFSKPGSNRSNMAGFTWCASYSGKAKCKYQRKSFFFKPGSNRSNMAGFTGSASAQLAQHRVTFPLRVKVSHFRDVRHNLVKCLSFFQLRLILEKPDLTLCLFPGCRKSTHRQIDIFVCRPPHIAHRTRQTWPPAGWSSLCLLFASTGQLTNSHLDCISEAHCWFFRKLGDNCPQPDHWRETICVTLTALLPSNT